MFQFKLFFINKTIFQFRCIAFDATKIKWEGLVGLEVHAQLQTNTKLFSGAKTDYGAYVNTQVSLFDAAIPGTLPVLNKECVKKGILTALALNCEVHPVSWFDRKHYFYADLPAGYQITQQRAPFATNGFIEFEVLTHLNKKQPYLKKSTIKQIQLEQDSGKSLHDVMLDMSLVDLNRAGNPLIEIVFEPDLNNGDEAANLIKELILILRTLETCSCKIEEGALRVDANVSIRPEGSKVFGIRSEVKNIGGVNSIQKAVNFEIERQIRLRKAGKLIVNETRAWDSVNNCTASMRDKEMVQDYRFMPEPNLPPLRLSFDENAAELDLINVPKLRKKIPLLPSHFRNNLIHKYKLTVDYAFRLLREPYLLNSFLSIVDENKDEDPAKVASFLLNNLLAALNRKKIKSENCKVEPSTLGELHSLFRNGIINRTICSRILDKLVTDPELSPSEVVKTNQWEQIHDESIIEDSCKLTIEYNKECVEKYRKSKKSTDKQQYFQTLFAESLNHLHGRAKENIMKEILEKLLQK